jgi:hypothetical protein
LGEGITDMPAKNRPSMVATPSAYDTAVLRQTLPQSRAGLLAQSVRADPNDAQSGARLSPVFTILEEEIDPAHRPRHAAAAVGELFGPTEAFF